MLNLLQKWLLSFGDKRKLGQIIFAVFLKKIFHERYAELFDIIVK